MKLFIKEEFMSMQDRMIVIDEIGQERFLIVGKWGRMGDSLSIYAMDGNRLAEAKQKNMSIFPSFTLYKDDEKVGCIKKHPGFQGLRKPYFTVSKLNWMITGNFEERNYTIRNKTRLLMQFQKEYSFVGDFYSLEIHNEEFTSLCCLISVIVDQYSPNKGTLLDQLKQNQYQFGFMHPMMLKFVTRDEKM